MRPKWPHRHGRQTLSDSWDDFIETIQDGSKALAKNTVQEVLDQAEADAKAFVEDSEASLRRWGDALAQGKITKEDFEYLVGGQKQLAKVHALKAVGLTQARLERFRTGLIGLVVSSAFDAIGIQSSVALTQPPKPKGVRK